MLNITVFFRLFLMVLIYITNPCSRSQTNTSSAKNGMHSIAIGLQKASKVNEIPIPRGYDRLKTDSLSFEYYLQNLPLNTKDNKIYSFDGSVISTGGYHYAVIDIDIGNKDLQQCADAVMRLRAEYLYKQKKYGEIHFNFLSDGKPRYYTKYADGDLTYRKFRKYMDYIFSYANSGSLRDEMLPINIISDIRIGDVFIQKGNPIGHAVVVVDMAINKENGKKIILIAQSYMPAQSIHILLNPNNDSLSPWYSLDFEDLLTLPSWTFVKKDLRRFK